METRTELKFKQRLSYYKPNKGGAGAAVQFDLNAEKQSVFVEIARQSGEKAFNWQEKMVFKLALSDMGKLLLVLRDKVKTTQLFHDPSKGEYALAKETKNATLSLTKGDYGYFLKVSQQGQDGNLNSIQMALADDEALVLSIMLEKAVEKSVGW